MLRRTWRTWLAATGALALLLACAPALGVFAPLLSQDKGPTPTRLLTTPNPAVAQPSPVASPTAEATTAAPAPRATSVPTTAAPAASPTAALTATATLDEETLAIMERIEQDVEELRGLHAQQPVEKVIITREELARKVEEDFLEDYSPEEAAQDAVELWLLGLTDRNFNMYEVQKAMLSEGIAGFYDDEEGKMYVVAEEFSPHARLTYAHEYTHALQDQTWDLDEGLGLKDEICENDTEYCAGVQALVEGDATVTEYLWFWEKATEEERESIRRYYQTLDMPAWDQSPEFMQEDMLFPYTAGQDFVLALFQDGGWEAVNAAYDDPPVSTEQILHPERYPDDRPQNPTLPNVASLLGDEWEAVTEENNLGEFWIYLTLAKSEQRAWRLDENEARRAAEGWGGDVYAVYHNPTTDQGVLLQILAWDTSQDAEEFTQAFLRYAELRFGIPHEEAPDRWIWEDTPWGTVIFARHGAQGHVWVIAPNRELAMRLFDAAH